MLNSKFEAGFISESKNSEWKCLQCGDCCKNEIITASGQELKILQNLSNKQIKTTKIKNNRYKIDDKGCSFLSNNTCTIYETRPCQCRLYHCGRKTLRDNKLTILSQVRSLMLSDPYYMKFKEDSDLEAITWGNKHGWNWKKLK